MEDYKEKNQNIIENLREEFDLMGEEYNEKNIDLLIQEIQSAIWNFEKKSIAGYFKKNHLIPKKNPLKCGEVVTALCFILEQEHKKMIDR